MEGFITFVGYITITFIALYLSVKIDEILYPSAGKILVKSINNPADTPYLDWIKSGIKTFEGRLKTRVVDWDLHTGRIIKFVDTNDASSYAIVYVTHWHTFTDFGAAFDSLGESLIPFHDRTQVIAMYNKIFEPENTHVDNVTCDTILRDGVAAIGFKLIGTNETIKIKID